MNPMRLVLTVLGRLRVGRFRDWYRFTWARLRTPGTILYDGIPHIDPPITLDVAPGATLKLGRNVRFRPGFRCYLEKAAVLTIGSDTAFNINCWIGASTRVTIGDGCLFGPFSGIVDGNHRFDQVGESVWHQGLDTREITVGSNVWVGSHVTIINSVGDNAVLGAHSLVTRPIPDGAVAVGIPARVQRKVGERADSTVTGV